MALKVALLAFFATFIVLASPRPVEAASTVQVAPVAQPAAASDLGFGPCSLLLDPLLKKACEAALGNGPIPTIPIPNVTDTIVSGILDQIMYAVSSSVADGLNNMMHWITDSTTPSLDSKWFIRIYAIALAYGFVLAFICFGKRGVGAAADRNPGELVSAITALLTFLVLVPTLPFVVNRLIQVCDGVIAPEFLDMFASDMKKVIHDLIDSLINNNEWNGAMIVPLVFGLVGAIAGGLLLVQFFIRMVVVYIYVIYVVFCLALCIAGRAQWPQLYRALWTLAGLILFKVLASFIMVIGVLMLGDPGQSKEAILYGSILLMLVPYLSWVAYKRISGHDINAGAMYRSARNLIPKGA